jgi:hypothetical protein
MLPVTVAPNCMLSGGSMMPTLEPQIERLVRYLAHLTAMGILDCRNPMLAAHQLMGMLNELSLWPWMTGRESIAGGDRGDDPDVPAALPAPANKAAKGLSKNTALEIVTRNRAHFS